MLTIATGIVSCVMLATATVRADDQGLFRSIALDSAVCRGKVPQTLRGQVAVG